MNTYVEVRQLTPVILVVSVRVHGLILWLWNQQHLVVVERPVGAQPLEVQLLPNDVASVESLRSPMRPVARLEDERLLQAAPVRPAASPAAADEPLPAPTQHAEGAVTNLQPLNMGLIYQQAREIADAPVYGKSRPVDQLKNRPAVPPEQETRLGRDIRESTRADCAMAYQSMGLLAPLGIAYDALTSGSGSGCKF